MRSPLNIRTRVYEDHKIDFEALRWELLGSPQIPERYGMGCIVKYRVNSLGKSTHAWIL